MSLPRTAVILFNLGGPDSLGSVRPFLFNLFKDPEILSVPNPFRLLLAALISFRRASKARGIYQKLGGASPLLPNTLAQARALESALSDLAPLRCFVSMRYWHPMAAETAAQVFDWGADRIVLLPLYPQFSRTTFGSSLGNWENSAKKAGLNAATTSICCYPTHPGFIEASSLSVRRTLETIPTAMRHRVHLLFSAHGLPNRVIQSGDPYQFQIEATAAAIVEKLEIETPEYWRVCYQSLVGPLKWIEPYIEQEIIEAGKKRNPVLVFPLSFVSEHSETLVELDIEYKDLAYEKGVPFYCRASTVGTDATFIAALSDLTRQALHSEKTTCRPGKGGIVCPRVHTACPTRFHSDSKVQ